LGETSSPASVSMIGLDFGMRVISVAAISSSA
jgi:hypothetical protein